MASIKSIDDIAGGEFPGVFGKEIPKEEESKKKGKDDKVKDAMKKMGFTFGFIKPGPYETTFEDRINGPYFTELGSSFWNPIIDYLKGGFKVPGKRAKGVM